MSDGGMGLLVIVLALYFVPTLVALARGKANGSGGVFFVNIVAGWTVLGWLVAFIWACSGQTQDDRLREEKRHRELLAVMGKGEAQS